MIAGLLSGMCTSKCQTGNMLNLIVSLWSSGGFVLNEIKTE